MISTAMDDYMMGELHLFCATYFPVNSAILLGDDLRSFCNDFDLDVDDSAYFFHVAYYYYNKAAQAGYEPAFSRLDLF